MKKQTKHLVIVFLILFFLLLNFVSSKIECQPVCSSLFCDSFETTCLDVNPPWFGSGDEDYKNQPLMQGGMGGSGVNPFSGNLMLSFPILSLKGRAGLDVSLNAYYNSNIYFLSAKDYLLHLQKPGLMGYGWNAPSMGKILVPHPECYGMVNQNYAVEFSDGSRYPFIKADSIYNSEYILPNFAKVSFYHNRDEDWLTDAKATDEIVITDLQGTKYIFSHWVPLGTPVEGSRPNYPLACEPKDPLTEENIPWSDVDPQARARLDEQHQYAGNLYLTKIIDVYGNYINVSYYGEKQRQGMDFDITYGSPFIKEIEDTLGRKIKFNVSNWNSQNARLKSITYEGFKGPVKYEFTYSGDLEDNPYSCTCNSGNPTADSICNNVCNAGALLTKVEIKNKDGDLLYPATTYEYYNNQGEKDFFKLKKINSPDKGIVEYNYKDILLDEGDGTFMSLNVISNYILKTTEQGKELRYDYKYKTSSDIQNWIRQTAFIGPANSKGMRTATITKYISSYGTPNLDYYALNSWRAGNTIEEDIYAVYDYEPSENEYEDSLWDILDSSDLLQHKRIFYKPLHIGKKEIYYSDEQNGLFQLKGDYYVPLKQAVVITKFGNNSMDSKTYAKVIQKYDKYGDTLRIENYGEVNSVSKIYTGEGCQSNTEIGPICNLQGNLNIIDSGDDNLITNFNYLHLDNSIYEGQNLDFQIIGKVTKKTILDPVNMQKLSEVINSYDDFPIFRYTPYAPTKDNFMHHERYTKASLYNTLGLLTKSFVWRDDKNNYTEIDKWYDEAGNLVKIKDQRGLNTYFYYTDKDALNPYYENHLPPCFDFSQGNDENDLKFNEHFILKNYDCDDGSIVYSGGSEDLRYHHAYLTRQTKELDGYSLVSEQDYDNNTGLLINELSYVSTSPSKRIGKRFNYDALGRQTEVYKLSDPIGSPSKKEVYDDFSNLRSITTFSKKDTGKILVVSYETDLSKPNTNILINILNTLNIPFKEEDSNAFIGLPEDMLDYDFIIIVSGDSNVINENDASKIGELFNNNKSVWIFGSYIFDALQTQSTLLQTYFNTSVSYIQSYHNFSSINGLREFKDVHTSGFYANYVPLQFSQPKHLAKAVLNATIYHEDPMYIEDTQGNIVPIYEWGHLIGILHDGDYKALLTAVDLNWLKEDERKNFVEDLLPAFRYGTYFNGITDKYDRLGRKIETLQKQGENSYLKILITYNDDSDGRKANVSKPFLVYENNTPITPISQTQYLKYDALGRVLEIKSPGVDSSRRTYGSNWEIDENPAHKKTKKEFDAYGKLIKEIDAYGTNQEAITQMQYNKLGSLKKVINPENQIFNYNYSSIGLLLNYTSPDSGMTINKYDDAGNLIQVKYANGKVINFEYDKNSRIIKIKGISGSSIKYKYDIGDFKHDSGFSTGKITKLEDESGIKYFTYNKDGLLSSEIFIPNCVCSSGCPDLNGDGIVNETDFPLIYSTNYMYKPNADFNGDGKVTQIDRSCFNALYNANLGKKLKCSEKNLHCSTKPKIINYSYNDADLLIGMKDFNGNVYNYSYDSLGKLNKVEFNGKVITQNYKYNPSGTIKEFEFGNGVKTSYDYWIRNKDLVKSIITQKQGENYFAREYSYDNIGNLLNEKLVTQNKNIFYSYDNLNRLNKVNYSDIYGFNIFYSYDKIGNRINSTFNNTFYQYIYYPNTNKLKQVSKLANYTYDAQGNLIYKKDAQGVTHFIYDYNNKLRKVEFPNGECIKYYYNANGNRYRKEESANGLITTYYYANGKLIYQISEYGAVSCNAICGDGLIEEDEICEPNNLNGKTCADFENYEYGILRCSSDCKSYVLDDCGYCGDGIINGNEECDGDWIKSRGGSIKQGFDCSAYNHFFNIGFLSCNPNTCKLDHSACSCECSNETCGFSEYACVDGVCVDSSECIYGKDLLPNPCLWDENAGC